ncbi:hypothetical protein PGTUg99_016823 [Puccinia graminis f. sp. tritici]|uniref:Uncharacterized protein n=1 Tax=Puccinia graminis f. sp. tritici TaxID=56615 RepID=A0A5B0NJ69_PUCGR|nr:hypothetical protein PGTUg99_016823 [Puccinia graminis f. sp. tritici]
MVISHSFHRAPAIERMDGHFHQQQIQHPLKPAVIRTELYEDRHYIRPREFLQLPSRPLPYVSKGIEEFNVQSSNITPIPSRS